MKPNFYLTAILFALTNLAASGQERISSANTRELIYDGEKSYNIGEYEDALEFFGQVNPNDTNGFLAFYDTALSLNALERYDESIELIEACKPSFWDKEPMLYSVYCQALVETDQVPQALEWYDKGQAQWPLNANLVYNKGVTLWEDDQHEAALELFERALELNPFHWNTHRQLGNICADEGFLTEALMCYNLCLISEYDYYYTEPILSRIDRIVSSNYSGESKDVNIYGKEGVSPHEELTLFIKNRVALDKKKYKFKHKFFKNNNIVKQYHLLISNVQYDEDDQSFWGRYYAKHFSELRKSGQLDASLYAVMIGKSYVSSSINKTITKNKSEVFKYVGWARNNWLDYYSEIEVPLKEEVSKHDVYRYTNGNVYLVGHKNEEDAEGYGETYHQSGVLSGKGNYSEGVQDGYWVNYHVDGSISGEYTIGNGELNGLATYYNEYGDRNGSIMFKDGETAGISRNFQGGVLNYEGNLEDQKFEGEFRAFYPDGALKYTYTMNESEADGDYTSYYANGKLETEFTREDKEIQGMVKTYYPDGKIYKEIAYEDDEENGPFAYYFYNGNKSSEGEYKDGKYVGTYKTYFNDGTLASETNYDDSGKENGTETSYVKQGWKLSEFQFKKGEVVSYMFFNSDGEVVKEAKKKGGEFYYESVDKDGTITSQGTYASGDKGEQGEWKRFNRNDYLESIINFEDGKRDGLFTSYFSNKQVNVECSYEEGARDGYYKENYQQGQLYSQGWIEEGELEGLWEYYHEDGAVSDRNYFIDDKLHGYSEDYSPEGVRTFARDYRHGNLVGLVIFDTTGVELNYYPIDTGLVVIEQYNAFGYLDAEKTYHNREAYGEWRWYYPNKKIASTGNFINGDRDGKWSFYYSNGQLSSEGSYFLGKRTGEWRDYHQNGKLDEIMTYEYGELTGSNPNYSDEGVLITETEFELGSRHGLAKYYSLDGKLQMMRKYEFGEIISIAVDNLDSDNPKWVTLKDETGAITTKYANGETARSFEVVKGSFQGVYVEYYDNGQILDTQTYLDDELHGEFIRYYRDGTLMAEGTYTHGEINGAYKKYHSNGKLKTTTEYVNGEAHGWSEEYDSNGKLVIRKYYYDGSLEIIE